MSVRFPRLRLVISLSASFTLSLGCSMACVPEYAGWHNHEMDNNIKTTSSFSRAQGQHELDR